MNNVTLNGYTGSIEATKKDDTIKVKFSICDQQTENCKRWYKCVYFTKSEKVVEFLKKKKENKERFTVVGTLYYVCDDNENETAIIVKVNNIA